jgi:hypothetical protein
MLVLEPIFETDLQPEQYAYRPEYARYSKKYLHEKLGLIQLRRTQQSHLWANG